MVIVMKKVCILSSFGWLPEALTNIHNVLMFEKRNPAVSRQRFHLIHITRVGAHMEKTIQLVNQMNFQHPMFFDPFGTAVKSFAASSMKYNSLRSVEDIIFCTHAGLS